MQEAVDDQRTSRLVHFVLDRLAADLHLDDHVDVFGRVLADGDGVDAHGNLLVDVAAQYSGRAQTRTTPFVAQEMQLMTAGADNAIASGNGRPY